MKPSRIKLLAMRLVEHPLLCVLLFNPWFRWVFLVAVTFVMLVTLSAAKIWRVTPPGFIPVVRASWLGKAQAESLRRSAIRFEAAGNPEAAAQAWQAAIANDIANPDLLRGALRQSVAADDINPKWVPQTVSQTGWLLRLTSTNQTDVELAAQVYDRYELSSALVGVLENRKETLTPREEAAYLKALFRLHRMDDFAERWQAAANRLPPDPQLGLFHATYLVGWGPPATMGDGRRQLEEALANPDRRLQANRLLLALCVKNADVPGYRTALGRLQAWHADRAVDHAGLWQLLLTIGQADEARRLAEDYVRPPLVPWDAVRLAETYLKLGMRDYTRRFLQRYAPEFESSDTPWAIRLWILYTDVLIHTHAWHELSDAAFHIRLNASLAASLGAYSYYLEGRALQGLGNPDQAAVEFTKAAQAHFRQPQLAFKTAIDLLKAGFPNLAWDLLAPLESDFAQNIEYWQSFFEVAYARKDALMLFKGASRAYALRPTDPACQNNYAASLLINRQRPDEAGKLTFALMSRNPDLLASKINHSYALAMNRRFDEAYAVLKTVDPSGLSPLELTMYHFTAFAVRAGRGEIESAKEASRLVNTNLLFPSQVKWLEQSRAAL